MDGTLLDSSESVRIAWSEFAERHGFDPDEMLIRAHGRKSFDTVKEHLPDASPAQWEAENDIVLRREVELDEGVHPIAGAAPFIARLHELGIPIALVTSAALELAQARMRAAGLAMPATSITAERVRHGKPNPEPFLLGAEALGVPIAHCLAFEDAEAGIQAAVAAGAQVVVVGEHRSASTVGLPRIADYQSLKLSAEAVGARVAF